MKSFSPWLAGMVWTMLLVLCGSIVISLLLQWSNIHETERATWSYVINGIALMFGGFIAGRKAPEKGWLHGAVSGAGYVVLMFLIGFLAFNFILELKTFLFLLFAAVISTIGGMIGVSLSP